jgi:5-methyltetrahydropteroyltriglutamate--homocysteine methyltransferase
VRRESGSVRDRHRQRRRARQAQLRHVRGEPSARHGGWDDALYYRTYEEYVAAIADVMRLEYVAIVDAGFVLQVDAPGIAGLRGIPEERVRVHVCWGNAEAPHTRDAPLRDVVDLVLSVNAGAYSVEAANPRHAHEWAVWRDVKLPDGKVLIPGVIDNMTNFVEHPELVAERIVRFAEVVGRENVIAGVDCGFATSAHSERVYPPVVWGKLRTLADGARLASKVLWPQRVRCGSLPRGGRGST